MKFRKDETEFTKRIKCSFFLGSNLDRCIIALSDSIKKQSKDIADLKWKFFMCSPEEQLRVINEINYKEDDILREIYKTKDTIKKNPNKPSLNNQLLSNLEKYLYNRLIMISLQDHAKSEELKHSIQNASKVNHYDYQEAVEYLKNSNYNVENILKNFNSTHRI